MIYNTQNSKTTSSSRKSIESHTGYPNPKLKVKMTPSKKDNGLMELKLKLSVSGADKKDNRQNCNISIMTDIADALMLYFVALFTISVVKMTSIFHQDLPFPLQTSCNLRLLSKRRSSGRRW